MAGILALAPLAAADTCVLSKNYANAQYTVPVQVGTPSQTLNAVPDTGSFELMMTSTDCKGCEGHPLFNAKNSTSFVQLGTNVETKFGQGDVTSRVDYDRVKLGSLVANKQSILLMTKNALRNFQEAAYDAVMGMGRELKARSYSDDLSLLASLKAPVTGVCVGQHDGEPGRLQVGAAIPGLNYVTMPVVGSTHWSINIDQVALSSDGKETAHIRGCEGTGCQAIVDSGTSLMALPKNILDNVLNQIGTIKADCSNVDELPNVRFKAGQHTFDLPPQLYVAKMMADKASATKLATADKLPIFRMPWDHATVQLDADAEISCMPLFMEMDIATSFSGPAMIFGLPFLRSYATAFDRTQQTVSFAQIPLGSSLCTHCGDTHASSAASALLAGSISLAADSTSLQPADPSLAVRERPVLNPRHLRLPSWLHKVETHPVTGKRTISL